MTKECLKCHQTKPFSDFHKSPKDPYGIRRECKECVKIYTNEYNKNNREKLKKKASDYRKENPTYNKDYYNANPDYFESYREENKEHYKQWRNNNREWVNNYHKEKKKNDPKFKITAVLRSSLSTALKKQGAPKYSRTVELLGCSFEKFMEYIKSKFQPGMTWDNYGRYGWHIDHIIPCISFDLTDPREQEECFHHTNLQPLWAIDNLKKGDRIEND